MSSSSGKAAKSTASARKSAGNARKATSDAGRSLVTGLVIILALVFVVLPMLPALGEQAVKSAGHAVVDTSRRVLNAGCLDGKVCPPANGNDPRLSPPTTASGSSSAATGPKKVTTWTTPPTSAPAAPKPYGPPNGPVRQLPSQTPPPNPRGGLPSIGDAPSGGLLGDVPVLGGALRELTGPALKALAP